MYRLINTGNRERERAKDYRGLFLLGGGTEEEIQACEQVRLILLLSFPVMYNEYSCSSICPIAMATLGGMCGTASTADTMPI